MRILIAHNRYQQQGGEDIVAANESRMLAEHGHEVKFLGMDNESIVSVAQKLRAAGGAFYSLGSAHSVKAAIDSFHPDVVHVHNFLFSLSPAVFFAAKEKKIPVVMTLHNYRLICANAQLFRDGRICEECALRRSFIPGVRHACYRGSRLQSAIVGASMALHQALGTWNQRVSLYIALTRFAAEKMSLYRIPSSQIRVKPNFAWDSGEGSGGGGFALYAGRLSAEKGVNTLIDADAKGLLPLPVHLAGDGPMMGEVQQAARKIGSRLIPLGPKPHSEVQKLMRSATVLILPSIWYEGFPLVAVEAFAAGLPIAGSRIGGLPEIVEDGVSGYLFPPGDCNALAGTLGRFVEGSAGLTKMRQEARRRFETQYSAEQNYAKLIGIYRELAPNVGS
jgi:glycosyltransferase involved in cell wall biosynthesis